MVSVLGAGAPGDGSWVLGSPGEAEVSVAASEAGPEPSGGPLFPLSPKGETL